MTICSRINEFYQCEPIRRNQRMLLMTFDIGLKNDQFKAKIHYSPKQEKFADATKCTSTEGKLGEEGVRKAP